MSLLSLRLQLKLAQIWALVDTLLRGWFWPVEKRFAKPPKNQKASRHEMKWLINLQIYVLARTRSHQLSVVTLGHTHIRGFAPRQHPPNHILKTVGLLLWHREARIFPVASIVILLLLLLLFFFRCLNQDCFRFACYLHRAPIVCVLVLPTVSAFFNR